MTVLHVTGQIHVSNGKRQRWSWLLMNMYLTQVIKTSILVPGKSSKHNILTGEKKKWFQVVIAALCCQHWSVMLQSLPVVIELFHQTLGVLSQDGFLRFIDIHACKQLFEIGGADEVLYPNEKVLISSPFLFFSYYFFFFSWLGLLFLYICSPLLSVNFCLLFILRITDCVMFSI